MIELLEKASLNQLAYADDLATICHGEDCYGNQNLIKAMEIIEKRAGMNDIEVKNKKSGIFIIQNKRCIEEQIRGYPINN